MTLWWPWQPIHGLLFLASEDIFLERMAVLVYVDKRPFRFKDFLLFDHDGKTCHYEHWTIRIIFSKLGKKTKYVHLSLKPGVLYPKRSWCWKINYTQSWGGLPWPQTRWISEIPRWPSNGKTHPQHETKVFGERPLVHAIIFCYRIRRTTTSRCFEAGERYRLEMMHNDAMHGNQDYADAYYNTKLFKTTKDPTYNGIQGF